MKRNASLLIFAAVFLWKITLFLLSAQPIPANDSFFYDGAVVNRLLQGAYCNPSLALAFPISGTQVFSAYPPLYQALLLGWMSLFGTSVLAAMALHLVLFGVYQVLLLGIFRQLRVPAWCAAVAGGFLLVLTFHDRPDSLAQVLGMASVYCWLRAPEGRTGRWQWLTVLFVVLALGTSLQIGGIYFLWIWIDAVALWLGRRRAFPWLAMSVMTLVPVILVLAVKAGFPLLWAGFLEHARQTPSFTGFRVPYKEEWFKVIRGTPGVILVAVLLPWFWFRNRRQLPFSAFGRGEVLLLSALFSSLAVIGACLFVLTANLVVIANYLQPVIVAGYLAFVASRFAGRRGLRLQLLGFSCALLLGSVRAVGMSTWGLACARDVSCSAARQRVARELDAQPRGSRVVLSSAFLYDAARHEDIKWIHSDWLIPGKPGPGVTEVQGLLACRPAELILTQFDYYRRYQAVLEKLAVEPGVGSIRVENTARAFVPDSSARMQRVVQHISWAPVIVHLAWK